MLKAIYIGRHIVETRNSIRTTAKIYKISPSTVSRYIHKILPTIDPILASQVKSVVDYNKAIAHLRGGEGNRIKHREEKR